MRRIIKRAGCLTALCLGLMSMAAPAGADSVEMFPQIVSGKLGGAPKQFVLLGGELVMGLPEGYAQMESGQENAMLYVSEEDGEKSGIIVAYKDDLPESYEALKAEIAMSADVRCEIDRSGEQWFAASANDEICMLHQTESGRMYLFAFFHECAEGGLCEKAASDFSTAIYSLRRAEETERERIGGSLRERCAMTQEPVVFEDAQFAAMLRAAMGLEKDAPVYPGELETIESLYIMDGGMDLHGWQRLRNPQFEQEAALSLGDLTLFPNLETLYVCDMQVTEVETLSAMAALRSVSLIGCGVDNLAPFEGMTGLRSLSLARCPIEKIDALSGLVNLENLNLFMTDVRDLGALSGMKRLTSLLISGTCVSSLEPLRGCTALERLNAGQMRGGEISLEPLGELMNLEYADFEGSKTTDREHIAHVENVRTGSVY